MQTIRAVLWQQVDAALQMLDAALLAVTDLPGERQLSREVRRLAFHTLRSLDRYLSRLDDRLPPPPFDRVDRAGPEPLPADPYPATELRRYLSFGHQKVAAVLDLLTEAGLPTSGHPADDHADAFELLLYNARHIQHHVGQMALLFRQNGLEPPRWIGKSQRPPQPPMGMDLSS